MDILAGEIVGVLAHVEAADEHRAGGLEPTHEHPVARGRGALPVDLRSGAGRQPFDVDEVLHGERHTGEGAYVLACGDLGVRAHRRGRGRERP